MRATETTVDQQLIDSGSSGAYGYDPIDGDYGWQAAGGQQGSRPVPGFTLERARAQSVSAYRSNPMGRAIIDTYTAFCVGDTGVRPESSDPDVHRVVTDFWDDPLVDLGAWQERGLRSHMLYGESLIEGITGELFGSVRLRPIDATSITGVKLRDRNPLWPQAVGINTVDGPQTLDVIGFDDLSGMRKGQVFYRADWHSVISDTRGLPFLTPTLDWLAGYDRTLWNLVDRTALARYMVLDVTVQGDQQEVDEFVRRRGGLDPPESGSIEVHNDGVKWQPMSAPSMSQEDTMTAQQILTNVAGGVGLAKPWISEAEGSNRASSVTMAEPVRRRIGGVQRVWLMFMREICRYVVDQAVRVGTLPRYVTVASDVGTGTISVPAAQTVRVVGPEIAGTDAQINATIVGNLAAALNTLVSAGLLGPEAARRMVEKSWADYMGQPWRPGLDTDATVQAWLDEWKPKAPAPAPAGAMPGVDNKIGTPGQMPMSPPGTATVNTGAPVT